MCKFPLPSAKLVPGAQWTGHELLLLFPETSMCLSSCNHVKDTKYKLKLSVPAMCGERFEEGTTSVQKVFGPYSQSSNCSQ